MQNASRPKPWYRILYVQVFIGILIGLFFPDTGKSLKPLGDGFVKLVKMIIAPIIFCTVAYGIASMSDMKRLGRIGLKALVYFEIVSTLALFIGLAVVNLMQPGAGFNVDPATLDPKIGKAYAEQAHSLNATDFLLNVIPRLPWQTSTAGRRLLEFRTGCVAPPFRTIWPQTKTLESESWRDGLARPRRRSVSTTFGSLNRKTEKRRSAGSCGSYGW